MLLFIKKKPPKRLPETRKYHTEKHVYSQRPCLNLIPNWVIKQEKRLSNAKRNFVHDNDIFLFSIKNGAH